MPRSLWVDASTATSRRHSAPRTARRATHRRYLMCPPEYFDVVYAINPWMDPDVEVDRQRALSQWEELRDVYLCLGHEVVTIAAVPGLPDMVFAANGGFVVDGVGIGARFAIAERAAEAGVYARCLQEAGITLVGTPSHPSEGEGDLILAGDVILAGSGYRTDRRAHAQVAAFTGREVVSLRLVDPRYFHLDLALCVLDDDTVAYLPHAFDAASREELRRRFPDAVLAEPGDAEVLGLNAVSDGRNVVLPREAEHLASRLEERGFRAIAIDLSELAKAGGGPKCCTLELRPAVGRIVDGDVDEEVSRCAVPPAAALP